MTFRLSMSIILALAVAYLLGFQRGVDHVWNSGGYIGCENGRLTMRNFLIDSVKSEAFHIGADPCNGDGAVITSDAPPTSVPPP
jgi:hypothetical protein